MYIALALGLPACRTDLRTAAMRLALQKDADPKGFSELYRRLGDFRCHKLGTSPVSMPVRKNPKHISQLSGVGREGLGKGSTTRI